MARQEIAELRARGGWDRGLTRGEQKKSTKADE
jgi:hypothetical protein